MKAILLVCMVFAISAQYLDLEYVPKGYDRDDFKGNHPLEQGNKYGHWSNEDDEYTSEEFAFDKEDSDHDAREYGWGHKQEKKERHVPRPFIPEEEPAFYIKKELELYDDEDFEHDPKEYGWGHK